MSNSDRLELSAEPHELNYILREFNLRQTDHNRRQLATAELAFKASKGGTQTKNYT